jgi:hypothetical protein
MLCGLAWGAATSIDARNARGGRDREHYEHYKHAKAT